MTDVISVGIDFSMSCPAMCVCVGEHVIENCKFYFLTNVKKYVGEFDNGKYHGSLCKKYNSNEERFDQISEHFMRILQDIQKEHRISKMNIEGYSMGSRGLVFNIGENTGILKHKLYNTNILFNIIPPTTVKKCATGKGNSDKNAMYNSFVSETKVNLKETFNYTKLNIDSPLGDIVDSYYICKF